MKLRCISLESNYYSGVTITIGKLYVPDIEQWMDPDKKCVYIIDDYGNNTEYPKECFISLDDYREQIICSLID